LSFLKTGKKSHISQNCDELSLVINYLEHLKNWAADLKESVVALYLAAKEPDTPRLAKWVIAITVAYALSPIDLIPDFIPVLGYLDDLLILPVGIWIAIRLIPDEIWYACKAKAAEETFSLAKNRRAAFVVVLLWVLVFVWLGRLIFNELSST